MDGPTYSWSAGVPSESNIADGGSRDNYEGLDFHSTIPICIYSQSLVARTGRVEIVGVGVKPQQRGRTLGGAELRNPTTR